MIEEDSVRGVKTVSLAIIDDGLESEMLRNGIGAARPEWRCLALRRFLHIAEKLRGRRLVEANALAHIEQADRFKKPKDPCRIDVGCVFGFVETDFHVTLCSQIVDLVGLHFLQDTEEARTVGHVAEMHPELRIDTALLAIEMLNPVGIERGGAAHQAMHFITLFDQQVGQIAAILACNARD